MHAANKTDLVQKMSAPVVKQAAYGETRHGDYQKKLMKNKCSGEAAVPANAVQQSSTRTGRVTKYNYNRELPMQKVLDFLKTQLPQQYALAEIVGRWIWLADGNRVAASTLCHLGFHPNQRRGVWQHPCGACAPFATHPADPRSKYGSYFVADIKPA